MYLIKNNPGDPRKLEMCFDCKSCRPSQCLAVVEADRTARTHRLGFPVSARQGQAIRGPRLPSAALATIRWLRKLAELFSAYHPDHLPQQESKGPMVD